MDEFVMTNEHEKIEMLLPWFVTGQLDAYETAQVDAHLLACAGCQRLFNREYQLKTEIASMSVVVPQFGAPATMQGLRPSIASKAWQTTLQSVSRWTAKPMRVAAFAAAQAAMLLIAFQLAQPTTEPGAVYRTLSSGEVTGKANAIVMFNADTREADFRAILVGVNATIVGGPTESNTYYLRIKPSARDNMLEKLRMNPQIMLAQPIDRE